MATKRTERNSDLRDLVDRLIDVECQAALVADLQQVLNESLTPMSDGRRYFAGDRARRALDELKESITDLRDRVAKAVSSIESIDPVPGIDSLDAAFSLRMFAGAYSIYADKSRPGWDGLLARPHTFAEFRERIVPITRMRERLQIAAGTLDPIDVRAARKLSVKELAVWRALADGKTHKARKLNKRGSAGESAVAHLIKEIRTKLGREAIKSIAGNAGGYFRPDVRTL